MSVQDRPRVRQRVFTPTEKEVIECVKEHQPITSQRIVEMVWGPWEDWGTHIVTVNISRINTKHQGFQIIKTKAGYIVEECPPDVNRLIRTHDHTPSIHKHRRRT